MQPINEQRTRIGMGMAAAAFLFVLQLGACSPEAGSPATIAASPPAPATVAPSIVAPDKATADARMRECRASLEAALPSGLVRNASVDNGRPKLWVGPAWQQSTPAVKEALARDAACFFLSGDESKTIRFSVYDDNDREVAVWNLSQLVTW